MRRTIPRFFQTTLPLSPQHIREDRFCISLLTMTGITGAFGAYKTFAAIYHYFQQHPIDLRIALSPECCIPTQATKRALTTSSSSMA